MVLEPEWLEDVTSLTRTHFCERQYLVDKFQEQAANEAILGGTIAHATFRQIVTSPRDNDLLQEALERALHESVISLAALGLDPEEVRANVLPPLRNLIRWARAAAPPGEARSETFLLAHRLGMRGRIDAAWEREDGRVETVAELKTGLDWNGRGRPAHELQVGAYALMLAERGEADLHQERLLLLYAGNPERNGQPNLERQVPFRIQTFANLVHFRNRLVLIDLTGRAVYQEPSRCRGCRVKQQCHQLTELLEQPRCASGCVLGRDCSGQSTFQETDREFFRRWARLLDAEWRAINDTTARLWRTAPAVRCADGSAAAVLDLEQVARQPDGRRSYRLRLGNDCELRQGDRVLLSEPAGPASGRVAQVEVLEAGDRELLVQANEALRFQPAWVDQYTSERLFLRAYAGLYSWLNEPPERRTLVAERHPPSFDHAPSSACDDLPGGRRLNDRQREALSWALRARDYLLIQGPPGTGKTELIAALARQLTESGRRVLLLSGTNRALDRLLEACARLDLEDRCIRLGHQAEPNTPGERRLLRNLLLNTSSPQLTADSPTLKTAVEQAHKLLFDSPIVAATIATIGGGTYRSLRGRFDTVIVDEASQVTLPAALGVLGFGRRFILVGDHLQLPPVVQSAQDAPGPGLSTSLFEYLAEARLEDGRPGLVRLEEQYRMNAEICAFPSQAWYDGVLRASPTVAQARLPLGPHPSSTAEPNLAPRSRWESELVVPAAPAPHPPSASDERDSPLLWRILDPDHPVVFVDIPGSAGNAPRLNRQEARLASTILEAARQAGLPAGDLAAIAPFRAQVALIRVELSRSADEHLRTLAHELADTVDRFQGSERSLVIYSFASHGPTLHPLMLDERRLNVALTRAKHKLILLGDLQILRAHPRFAQLEHYCRSLYPDGVVRACHTSPPRSTIRQRIHPS